jgi:hypothetical protein
MMFQTDPVKNLESRVYADFEGLKHEIIQQVRTYVEGKLQNQTAVGKDEILIEIEPKMVELVREEVRREL